MAKAAMAAEKKAEKEAKRQAENRENA